VCDTQKVSVQVAFENFEVIINAYTPQQFMNNLSLNTTHEVIEHFVSTGTTAVVEPLEPNIAKNPATTSTTELEASITLASIPDYLIAWVEGASSDSTNGPENYTNHRLGFPILSCSVSAHNRTGILGDYESDELLMRSVEYGAQSMSRRMFAPFAIHGQNSALNPGVNDHNDKKWAQSSLWSEPGTPFIIIDPEDLQLVVPQVPGANVTSTYTVRVRTRHPMWKPPQLAGKNYIDIDRVPDWPYPTNNGSPWQHHGVANDEMNEKLKTAHDNLKTNEMAFNIPKARNVRLNLMGVNTVVMDLRPGQMRKSAALFGQIETSELCNSLAADIEGEITVGHLQRNMGQGMGTVLGGGVGGGLGINSLMKVSMPGGDDPMGGPTQVSFI
jgi:hypothetical protein